MFKQFPCVFEEFFLGESVGDVVLVGLALISDILDMSLVDLEEGEMSFLPVDDMQSVNNLIITLHKCLLCLTHPAPTPFLIERTAEQGLLQE